jgi:hypothetical protein
MFIDYNLYGMNMLNVAAVKFRRKAQDGKEFLKIAYFMLAGRRIIFLMMFVF